MAQLIDELFVKHFDNPWLAALDDQARFETPSGSLVMATDSHVVTPLFFPGGDIGSLAFNGTVNDIAMAGAQPLYLAATFILEEGFALADLKRIVESMASVSKSAGVPIVTGDTKVVERGKADGVFITTTGIGVVPPGVRPSGNRARPGDRILVSGPMGDHGVAIMSQRENLSFGTTVESDSRALHELVAAMIERVPDIHSLRDPTRGGLASTLNELASQSGVGMLLEESSIPVRPEVRAACELLGLDPLYVACEGRLVALCGAEDAEALLGAMRAHSLGKEAAVVGEVVEDPDHFVEMKTAFGGRRMVDWLSGEQLPAHLLTAPAFSVRILLLTHSFNSLTQRLYVELTARGHELTVEFDINDAVTDEALALFEPELLIAPFLKRRISERVWSKHTCLIVHPGIVGDRGPSALDWAILAGEHRWGVTVLQATEVMDAGPVWATAEFAMRPGSKSSLYRIELTEAAVEAVSLAVERFASGHFEPREVNNDGNPPRGQPRPRMRQSDRAIDWSRDDTATVLRKIWSADGHPGVRDEMNGEVFYLFNAVAEDRLRGEPGRLIGRRNGAVCRATTDGAVWITHLKPDLPREAERAFKLPAAAVLGPLAESLPEVPLGLGRESGRQTLQEIVFEKHQGVGFLHFDFYNGAMATSQCQRLQAAFEEAAASGVRVLVLCGGEDFWCNGINLNAIEAAESPADESWRNINAMDDLCRSIVLADTVLTVSALGRNAGAGGVFLALAGDRVVARSGVVLNPHYKNMGNLYGSEYWTYLLPARVGEDTARSLMNNRLPLQARGAHRVGLVDTVIQAAPEAFLGQVRLMAREMAETNAFHKALNGKRQRRARDEAHKPLDEYRHEELQRMRLNFYGFDPSYHVARYAFVHKRPMSRTPLHLALHRRLPLRTPA